MTEPTKPSQNGFGILAGYMGFFAVVCFIIAIWSGGISQRHWAFMGLLFLVISILAAIPGYRWHKAH